MPFLKPFT